MDNFSSQKLSNEDRLLIEAYQATGISVDALPYSDAIDQILRLYGRDDVKPKDVYNKLLFLRKSGRLPRIGRDHLSSQQFDTVTNEQLEWLTEQVIEQLGSLGRRDHLPYSNDFENIKENFYKRYPHMKIMGDNALWLAIARRAKFAPTDSQRRKKEIPFKIDTDPFTDD